jgi:formylglycine-generating enzyme required for sulfatase activity
MLSDDTSYGSQERRLNWAAIFCAYIAGQAMWGCVVRSGEATRYRWENQLVVRLANSKGRGGEYDPQQTAKVNGIPLNAFSLHSISGSVAQWVSNCWFASHRRTLRHASSRDLPDCGEHVQRGCSWRQNSDYVSVPSLGTTTIVAGRLWGIGCPLHRL